MRYFEKKEGETRLTPHILEMALPSMRPNVPPGTRDTYHAPYLTLLPHHSLRIEKTEVEFNVSLNGIAIAGFTPDSEDLEEKGIKFARAEEQPNLQIDLNGNWGKSKDLSAKFKFIVSSLDLPEGTMRMIDEICKTNQGYVASDKSGTA
jgi:hypothetical protein